MVFTLQFVKNIGISKNEFGYLFISCTLQLPPGWGCSLVLLDQTSLGLNIIRV